MLLDSNVLSGSGRERKIAPDSRFLCQHPIAWSANMSDAKLPIDPKELTPAAIGLMLGVAMLIGFGVLASVLGLTLFVDHGNIPYQ